MADLLTTATLWMAEMTAAAALWTAETLWTADTLWFVVALVKAVRRAHTTTVECTFDTSHTHTLPNSHRYVTCALVAATLFTGRAATLANLLGLEFHAVRPLVETVTVVALALRWARWAHRASHAAVGVLTALWAADDTRSSGSLPGWAFGLTLALFVVANAYVKWKQPPTPEKWRKLVVAHAVATALFSIASAPFWANAGADAMTASLPEEDERPNGLPDRAAAAAHRVTSTTVIVLLLAAGCRQAAAGVSRLLVWALKVARSGAPSSTRRRLFEAVLRKAAATNGALVAVLGENDTSSFSFAERLHPTANRSPAALPAGWTDTPLADSDAHAAAALRAVLEPLPGCGTAYAPIGGYIREYARAPRTLGLHVDDVSEHAAGWHLARPPSRFPSLPPAYYELRDGASQLVLLQLPVAGAAILPVRKDVSVDWATSGEVDASRPEEWYYDMSWWQQSKLPILEPTGNPVADFVRAKVAANVLWLSAKLPGALSSEGKGYRTRAHTERDLCDQCSKAPDALFNALIFSHVKWVADRALLLSYTARYIPPHLAAKPTAPTGFVLVPHLPESCAHLPGGDCGDGAVPCRRRVHQRALVGAACEPFEDLTAMKL